jgi:hypothetical protein
MRYQNQQPSYGQIPLSLLQCWTNRPEGKISGERCRHSIFFTPNEIAFVAFQQPNEPGNQATTSSVVRSSLANSNPNPTISGLEKLPELLTFF